MTIQFFQTRMGSKFYETDVPRISRALERIADRLDKTADAIPHVRRPEIAGRCEDYLAGFDYAFELVSGYEFSSPLTADRAREAIQRELDFRRAQFVAKADRT